MPNSPCGSVYDRKHLLEILKFAESHQLPVIADEIYHKMVFPQSGVEVLTTARLPPLTILVPFSGIPDNNSACFVCWWFSKAFSGSGVAIRMDPHS